MRDGPRSSLAALRSDLAKGVAAVESSRRGSRWKEGVAIGGALGAATGLALSLVAPEEPEGISTGTAILLGTAAFAVLGAVAGGLVGALFPVR